MTSPVADEALYEAIRASWAADAPTYDASPTHGLHSRREQFAWRKVFGQTFDRLGQTTPLRILDVGAGTGEMAVLLANMGYKVTGIDLTPAMLKIAQEKADLLGIPVILLEGRAEQLPFADDSFDVVFSRHLFWTLPKPVPAVREWARVTRPGGLVAIADGWWANPSGNVRRALAKPLRRLFEGRHHEHPGYDAIGAQLPLNGGVSPYSIRYYLDQGSLERIRVRDLKSIRRAERRSLPLYRWIDQPRYTYLASGFRPE